MKLSEKLESLGIDLKNDKEEVINAKKMLEDAGLGVKSIASKLDSNQEEIINKAFSNRKNKNDVNVNEDSAKKINNEKIDSPNKEPKKIDDLPFWKKKSVKVVARSQNANKISQEALRKFDKKEEVEQKRPRALPEATILELKRRREEERRKLEEQKKKEVEATNKSENEPLVEKEKSTQDIKTPPSVSTTQNIRTNQDQNNQNRTNNQYNRQSTQNTQENRKKYNISYSKDNRNSQNNNAPYDQRRNPNPNYRSNNNRNQNNQSGQNYFNRNNNNQNKDRKTPQIPNQGGMNKKVILNKVNADSITGTNVRFAGKERDKSKFKKDQALEKRNQKNYKQKENRKPKQLQNFTEEEKAHTRLKNKSGKGAFIKPEIKQVVIEDTIKSIIVGEIITIKELSSKLKLQPAALVKKLFMQGKIVTPNTELSYTEAENIALEFDILCEKEEKIDVIAELLKENEESIEELVQRPPVVCAMGHVDHGKTSILDAIRKTNVISKEAGGITQAIGAYQVKMNNRLITFLDTPGHEAFTQMRMRGANATDIAVLVVAADDGVMPQTIEAINHAKAAKVEIVVCINKIDKENANIERVKQELSEYELIPSDWGGTTTFVPVSAKTGEGIKELLDMILLTADVLDLKANPNRNARGVVIEAELDKGKGPVARVLVQKGTLHIGDYVAMGPCYGKIRAMMDYKGDRVKQALPSTPVEILGLSDVPNAGDVMIAFDSEKAAKIFAGTFVSENKQKLVEASKVKVSLEDIGDMIKSGELKELPIVLKADVDGSVEAVKNSLEKLSNGEVKVKVIHAGVGNINESDATLASASNAIIIGFNVKPDTNAKSIIEREKVDLKLYDIIYNAIDDVERAIKGLQAPVYEEKIIGHATIRQIFKSSGLGQIAGSYVDDGFIQRGAKVRLFRNNEKIYEGKIDSVKRFKDDVKEVKLGFECGIVFDDFTQFEEKDIIEAYIMEEKKVD